MPHDSKLATIVAHKLRSDGCPEREITRTVLTLETNFSLERVYARTTERWVLDNYITGVIMSNAALSINSLPIHNSRLLTNAIYITPNGRTAEEQYEFGRKILSRLEEYFVHNITIYMQPITHTDNSRERLLLRNRNGKVVLNSMIPENMPPGTVLIRGPGIIYLQALTWGLVQRVDSVLNHIETQTTPLVPSEYLEANNIYTRRSNIVDFVLASHQPPANTPELEAHLHRLFHTPKPRNDLSMIQDVILNRKP
jgi:hypothetical protein